jgi:hypothetical protein
MRGDASSHPPPRKSGKYLHNCDKKCMTSSPMSRHRAAGRLSLGIVLLVLRPGQEKQQEKQLLMMATVAAVAAAAAVAAVGGGRWRSAAVWRRSAALTAAVAVALVL